MRTLRKTLAVAVVGLAVTGMTACGSDSSSSSGGEGDVIRIAYTPGSPTLQVHLADTMGYFEDRGLNVELTEGLDLPTWIASLDRQYDIAMTTAGIFITGADQFDLMAVGGAQMNRADVLGTPLVTDDPDIQGPGDLAGKRIGVVTLTGTTPASLGYLVEQAGGDPSSLDLVQVPFGSQADQLAAGQVDAVVSALPYATALEQANPANRAVFDVPDMALRDLAPDQEQTAFLMFTATRSWTDANPDQVTAFQEAMQDAIDWMTANQDQALDEMQSWLGLPAEVLDAAPFPPPVSSTVSQDEVEPIVTLYEEQGLIEEDAAPDLSDRFLD